MIDLATSSINQITLGSTQASAVYLGNVKIWPNGRCGYLYNYYAVTMGKLAPTGYHVPTYTEWQTLSTYLGGATVAGGKLKEVGTANWLNPNTGATNTSGFTAFPSGMRDSNFQFVYLYADAYYWSSTVSGDHPNNALAVLLDYNTDSVSITNFEYYNQGLSIRCIKDSGTGATMTDYDGNVYSTVTIGTQVWMASNLKTTHYNDGTLIPLVTDATAWGALTTGARCAYNNDLNNV